MNHLCPNLVLNKLWLVLLLVPLTAFSHPHSWIDLKTEVLGNKTEISGFQMDWIFDAMTTAYLFDGEDMSEGHRGKTLQKLAQSVIDNMLSQHYFTYFYDKGTPIKYHKVKQATLTVKKGKATLSFQLELAKPYVFSGRHLTLKIFDPTYYVDMSWRNKNDVSISDVLKPYCQLTIVEPHPTSAQVSYAMSIPADADPDDQLGQLFTQTLDIRCQASQ